jgi:HSP20 family protein
MTHVKFLNNGSLFKDTFVPKAFTHLVDSMLTDALPVYDNAMAYRPRVDVLEREKQYELHIMMPGLNKEDIKIDLEEKKLTISAERKQESEESGVKYHAVESFFGKFSRSFNLPKNSDIENIGAEFKNGILVVSIPKAEPAKTSKSIEIK